MLRFLKNNSYLSWDKFIKFGWRNLTSTPLPEKTESLKKELNEEFVYTSEKKPKKPYKGGFLSSLFDGEFDRNIFNYPSPQPSEENLFFLKHCIKIEEYISKIPPNCHTITQDMVNGLNALKVFALSLPKEYGGLNYSVSKSKFVEEYISYCPIIGQFLAYNENFGRKIINEFGSEEQKLKYLPKLASGKSFVCFAYLEDGPIIDLNSITTSSMFDNYKNEFIINGNKKWVLNADLSDFIIVLTRTTINKDNRLQTPLNLFIVDSNTPGITIKPCNTKNNQEINLFEINFKDVSVSSENLIGNESECAFPILKTALLFNKLSSSIACLSLLKKLNLMGLKIFEDVLKTNKTVLNEISIKENINSVTLNVYILESVIYPLLEKLDEYEKPDLYVETCIVKVIEFFFFF